MTISIAISKHEAFNVNRCVYCNEAVTKSGSHICDECFKEERKKKLNDL